MPSEMTDDVEIYINGTALGEANMNSLFRVEVEQTTYIPSVCRMTFFDDSLSLTDDTKIDLEKAVEVKVSPRGSQDFTSLFKGEIVTIQPELTEGLQFTLTIIAFDKMYKLNRGTKSRTFLQMTDSDIIKSLAGEAGLSVDVEATTEVHEYIAQDNISDLAMVQMLARRNSMQIVWDDQKLVVKKRPASGSAVVTLVAGEDILNFRSNLSSAKQVETATVRGWNPKTLSEVVSSVQPPKTHPTVGYGKAGTQVAKQKDAWVETRTSTTTKQMADTIAQARLNEINAGFQQCEARVFGSPLIKAGAIVKLDKLGTRFSGSYTVTVARHMIEADGYVTEFTVDGLIPSLTSGFLVSEPDPPRAWGGVVPAIVTNNNDPEKTGRVKVKFPWMADNYESNWARVVTMDGGVDRGFMVMPEVNDEVLVAFENGFFDAPYVIGGLYSGKVKPIMDDAGFLDSGKVGVRRWKTRTGHEMIFTEKASDSKIEIKEKDGKVTLTMDGKNKKVEIVNDDMTVTIDKTGKKITVDASAGDVEVKGKNIKLTATGTMDLSASGAVTIKGATVKIN